MRLFKIVFASALGLGCVGVAVLKFGHLEVERLTAQVASLEKEKHELGHFIERLSASRRVAQVDIVGQFADEHGHTHSTIRWVEIAPDGTLSEPQTVDAIGELVYFEAAVIKFVSESVGKGETGKSSSLAAFRRIFGEMQTPALVANLEPFIPANQKAKEVLDEGRLWDLFWELMDDPTLAGKYGVRTAQCEAPAVRVHAGQIWEVSLDAAGGLNVRLIGRRDGVSPMPQPIAAAPRDRK
ncbi:MAG: hypothetical protein HY287_00115 [Planctomycetes bacterium]|nr:hypothetical protein [Planctomycetota bacterium]MBI3832716.1 hypothetical protein [Planctomycetota bacterium]